MKGVQHQQSRRMHYDSFKDATIMIREELNKRPCKHFSMRGTCNFMENCRFSHLSDTRRHELEQEIQHLQEMKMSSSSNKKHKVESTEEPSLDQWLEKVDKSVKDVKPCKEVKPLPVYEVAPCLQSLGVTLPPSLLPPPPDVFDNLPLVEWG